MSEPTTPPAAHGGHETRDIAPRWIVLAGAALAGLLVASGGGMVVLQGWLAAREARRTAPASPLADTAPQTPPAPRLQTDPLGDLTALRAWEREQLETYGWVDRERGIVRVPVARAIELVLRQRGGQP